MVKGLINFFFSIAKLLIIDENKCEKYINGV